jgi:C-terminal processing protease CtpA/Prc
LNDAAALIVDLRDNGGGMGDAALQIAGYLFARPTFMYDPRPGSPVAPRTAPVAGSQLVDKPVFILTSSRTQSAAEYLAYNLKMSKRASVVGETTAGRQHSGAFRRIDDHFGIGIQEAAPPANPYPVKGWEIIGVAPDVNVAAADAFDAARRLALQAITRRAAQPER